MVTTIGTASCTASQCLHFPMKPLLGRSVDKAPSGPAARSGEVIVTTGFRVWGFGFEG